MSYSVRTNVSIRSNDILIEHNIIINLTIFTSSENLWIKQHCYIGEKQIQPPFQRNRLIFRKNILYDNLNRYTREKIFVWINKHDCRIFLYH